MITLTVIGVIAALTIPALISNTNEAEYKTAWKKAYAELSQAYHKVLMENAGTFRGLCPVRYDVECLSDQFERYLSYTKDCGTTAGHGLNDCSYKVNTTLQELNGNVNSTPWTHSSLLLNNGSFFWFGGGHEKCAMSYGGSIYYCGSVVVDVNGFKGPNVIGKDVYGLFFTKDRLYPMGALEQDNASIADKYGTPSCDKTNINAIGWGCSAKYLME